jgi:hypothetical protein
MIRMNLFAGLPKSAGGAGLARNLFYGGVAGVMGLFVVALVILTLRAMMGDGPATTDDTSAQTVQEPQPAARVPYESMGLPQRVAYEMAYTRNAFEALSSAMPQSLGTPRAVVLDSFRTIVVTGQSSSKDAVVEMLGKLRTEDLTLLSKPRTTVAVSGSNLDYTATVTTLFPLGDYDSTMSHLPRVSEQANDVKRVEQFAADAGVKIRKGLRYVSKQKAGRFQRLVYRMDASTSLADFITFVRNVHAADLGCAFANVRFTAGSTGGSVTADLLLNAIE